MDEDTVKRQAMLKLYEELQQVEKEQSEGAKWYTVDELEKELECILKKFEHKRNELPDNLEIIKDKPRALGTMTNAELDIELNEGLKAFVNGKGIPADELDSMLKNDFNL